MSVKTESTSRHGPHPVLADEAIQRHLFSLLRAGFSRRLAAMELGIDPSTIARSIKRDPAFAAEVRKAEEQFLRVPILTLMQAARTNWRAAAWLMKHYQPHESVKRRAARREQQAFADKKHTIFAALADASAKPNK